MLDLVRTLATEELEPLGLTPRAWGVLSTLREAGPLTQIQLARALSIDRTAMVYLLDEMEDAKLIERVRNPADRRSFLIQLTDRGRTTQRKAARALAGQTGRLLHPLTQAERRRASRSIGRRGAREPGYGSLCPAGTHEPV